MHYLLKLAAGCCLAGVAVSVTANAQQSSSQSNSISSRPGSLAPLSSGVPKLDKYTAPSKGSELVFNHSTVRLIAGDYKDGAWTAGVEIEMTPGWKTYWRVPGDAGVPAEFIWKDSSNVKSAKVFWPAPNRYEDITGKSIGYKHHVIFPVKVIAENAGQPAKLNLMLYYAICSDICVPAQANLNMDLPVDLHDSYAAEQIKEYAALVPNTRSDGISVASASVAKVDGKPVLVVKLDGPVKAKTDILVEGFEDAFFDAPKPVSSKNGEHVFQLAIDGIDKISELSGKKLKLTVLSGDNRFETGVTLN